MAWADFGSIEDFGYGGWGAAEVQIPDRRVCKLRVNSLEAPVSRACCLTLEEA